MYIEFNFFILFKTSQNNDYGIRAHFINVLVMGQRSNTEERFVYTKSLIRIKKEINKYKAKPNPKVTNVRYINEVLTTLALIPKRSAIR